MADNPAPVPWDYGVNGHRVTLHDKSGKRIATLEGPSARDKVANAELICEAVKEFCALYG